MSGSSLDPEMTEGAKRNHFVEKQQSFWLSPGTGLLMCFTEAYTFFQVYFKLPFFMETGNCQKSPWKIISYRASKG